MRQIYEDTFAFVRGFYRPRSPVYELPLHTGSPAAAQLAVRFANLGDALLGQGLWLGRRERPDRVTHLRLVEPDPNQSYWLILTFRTPAPETLNDEPAAQGTTQSEAAGVITLEARDGTAVEIGRYTLDGSLTTRWFTIPAEALRRGVPGNPADTRLTYTIRFSVPVEVQGGWLRSQQHVVSWERERDLLWESIDPGALAGAAGRTLPGVRWDDASQSVQWFGLDSGRTYLAGVETERRTLVWNFAIEDASSNVAVCLDEAVGLLDQPGRLMRSALHLLRGPCRTHRHRSRRLCPYGPAGDSTSSGHGRKRLDGTVSFRWKIWSASRVCRSTGIP